jgi:hypothetical protein
MWIDREARSKPVRPGTSAGIAAVLLYTALACGATLSVEPPFTAMFLLNDALKILAAAARGYIGGSVQRRASMQAL